MAALDGIIHNYLPSSWYPMHGNTYQLFEINRKSEEYLRLLFLMNGKFNKSTRRIVQVQNPLLFQQFQVKVAERSLYGPIEIQELMHCTAAKNVDSIVNNNLDWRYSNRVKYGHGVSFSKSAAYANIQSSLKNGTERAMIVADVIVGKKQIGNDETLLPDEPCDTTVSKCGNVYVKYYDDEFYPKYVIYYDSLKVKTRYGQRYYVDN